MTPRTLLLVVVAALAEAASSSAQNETAPAERYNLRECLFWSPVSVEGEISGLTLGGRGHVHEVFGAARLHLTNHIAATGGYRKLALEGRPDDQNHLMIDLGTWTFGAEISL